MAAVLPRSVMNSRRLIAAPEAKGQGIVSIPACILEARREAVDVRFGFKSRHFALQSPCPLYPRKRTFAVQLEMSAMGQKRTSGDVIGMSDKGISGQLRWYLDWSEMGALAVL